MRYKIDYRRSEKGIRFRYIPEEYSPELFFCEAAAHEGRVVLFAKRGMLLFHETRAQLMPLFGAAKV